MSDEAGPLRLMLTLGVAGMLSGLILVGVYLVTAPRIERNRTEALEAAISRVLPGTVTRETWVLKDGAAAPLPEGAARPKEAVYAGFDAEGRRIGFAVPAAGAGFQDTIELIYGLVPETRKIIGMEVLSSLETPGLGDKITKDPVFAGSFDDLAVDPEVVAVKRGAVTHSNQVDGITGATISSKAVVKIVNQGNAQWLGPLSAPPAEGAP